LTLDVTLAPPLPGLEPIRFASVAVFAPVSRPLTFKVPDAIAGEVRRGARVVCSFRNRQIFGVVLAVEHGHPDVPADKLKPILAVADAEPVVPDELLDFLIELSRYYIAPIGEVMRLAMPAIERGRAQRLNEAGVALGRGAKAVGRTTQHVTRVARAGNEPPAALKGQARAILSHLDEVGDSSLDALRERFSNARAAVKRLESLGLVGVEQRSSVGNGPFETPVAPDVAPALNAAQQRAVDDIAERLAQPAPQPVLLHGVTGSGKTEVYLRAVQATLQQGGGALVLVPEIALTPQLVGRFRARLGDTIAVVHSGLSERDRYGMWKRLREGELKVAVGARSALFSPLPGLRLICVDEEQDGSFKQEEGVRYNARDMALLRAHRAGALCVLGSATPSLKSFWAVRAGKLGKLVLPERAKQHAVLPKIELVDLRRIGPGPTSDRLISLPLYRALQETLVKREQAILFLNRRGFAPSVVCEECGHILGCPSCEVALTYHVAPRPHVVCHYCDYSSPPPAHCTECKSERQSYEGSGTERIENALAQAFPEARIGRLDRDTGAGLKSAHVLGQMHARELDILVGTQMVTKGHDLPDVSLVGVLNADAGLSMPDYQASERTFQLLVQVAGRAGRGETPGRVLIQTRNPEHEAIRLAVDHDVEGFVAYALGDREAFGYPPFSQLGLVRVSAVDENVAREGAEKLAQVAVRVARGRAQILGPSPAPITRLRHQYRFRFMVRAEGRALLRHVLNGVAEAKADSRLRVVIDVDPMSML
jgi:primosomal protein N' (replication factor Y)